MKQYCNAITFGLIQELEHRSPIQDIVNDIEVIYTQFKVQFKVEYIVFGTIEHFENTLLVNGKHINI